VLRLLKRITSLLTSLGSVCAGLVLMLMSFCEVNELVRLAFPPRLSYSPSFGYVGGGYVNDELTWLGYNLQRLAEQADALQGLIQRANDFNNVRTMIEEIPSGRINEEARQRLLSVLAEEEQDAQAKVRRYRERGRL
jgi:hypothetical protein